MEEHIKKQEELSAVQRKFYGVLEKPDLSGNRQILSIHCENPAGVDLGTDISKMIFLEKLTDFSEIGEFMSKEPFLDDAGKLTFGYIRPISALEKAKTNLAKYYQNWQQNTPIGNDAPADTVKKAKELSDWIKEAEASENPQKSAFVTLAENPAANNPDFDPNNPPLIPDDELDW